MLFLVLILTALHANVVCNPVGDLLDSALLRVEELETQLSNLKDSFPRLYEKEVEGSVEHAKVLREIDVLTSDIINGQLTNIQARKKADGIQNQIQHLHDKLTLIYRRNQKPEFADLLNEPILISANKIYEVETPSGKISFSLHPKIVNEVFWDSGHISQNIAHHFLKAIGHGFAQGRASDGIVRMKAEEAVMELKIVGRVGNHRLYGYIRNGHYRFIMHISHHTNHSANNARAGVIERMGVDMQMAVVP